MDSAELKSFANNYSQADFDKIKFDWNGKHADEFSDPNYDFRMQLCMEIKDDLDNYSLELIKDLYSEVFACAKETWGIAMWASKFAEALLEKGGTEVFDIYMKGAIGSMDAGMASGNISLSPARASEIYDYVKKLCSESPENAKRYEFMEQRFKWLKEKN